MRGFVYGGRLFHCVEYTRQDCFLYMIYENKVVTMFNSFCLVNGGK
jgi:hypothetical protein